MERPGITFVIYKVLIKQFSMKSAKLITGTNAKAQN